MRSTLRFQIFVMAVLLALTVWVAAVQFVWGLFG